MSRTPVGIAYGTVAQVTAMTPEQHELIETTDGNYIVIGDNVTVGGRRKVWTEQVDNHTRSVPTNGGTTTSVAAETCRYFAHSSVIAGHTLVFPPSPIKGQKFKFLSRSAITTLTLTGGTGGATVVIATIGVVAGVGAQFIYDNTDNLWLRT